MKQLKDLTQDELEQLVNDLHNFMWAEGGCQICAHAVVEQREPYVKIGCELSRAECQPLWRGFAGEPDSFDPDNPSF